jgi:hypothetical protein
MALVMVSMNMFSPLADLSSLVSLIFGSYRQYHKQDQ